VAPVAAPVISYKDYRFDRLSTVGGIGPQSASTGTGAASEGVVPARPCASRAAVDRYLVTVTRRRLELEAAIVEARARLEAARRRERRLEELERTVGAWVVQHAAHRRGGRGDGAGASATPGPRPLVPAALAALDTHLEQLRAVISRTVWATNDGGPARA